MLPFTCHWYVGVVPPLVGVAVNVTASPEQIAPLGLATILTAGTTVGLTVIVIPLDVAVGVEGHVALDVKIHVTISPLTKAALE